jgi:hypothetical protein
MLGLTHQAAPLGAVGALDTGPEFAWRKLARLAEAPARLDFLRLAPRATAEGDRQYEAGRKAGMPHDLGIALAAARAGALRAIWLGQVPAEQAPTQAEADLPIGRGERQERGQVTHLGEDERGTGVLQTSGLRASGVAKHGHAGRGAGRNPSWRIFDDRHAVRAHAHLRGGEHEYIGSRLASRNLRDAEEAAVETIEQSGQTQRGPHFRVVSARRDTAIASQGIQNHMDARDRLKLLGEGAVRAFPQLIDEARRNVPPQHFANQIEAVSHRVADEPLEHIVDRDGDPELHEHRREHAIGDELAIDEHAITVENDEIETRHQMLGQRIPKVPPFKSGCTSKPLSFSLARTSATANLGRCRAELSPSPSARPA